MSVCKLGNLGHGASVVHTVSTMVSSRPNSIPTIAFVVSTYNQSVGVNHSMPFICSATTPLMPVTLVLKIIDARSPRNVCQNCI